MAIRKKPGSTTTKTTYTKTNRRGKTKSISETKYNKRTGRLTHKGKAKKEDTEYGLDLSKRDRVTRSKKETTTKTNKKGKAKKTSFSKTTVKTTIKPKKTKTKGKSKPKGGPTKTTTNTPKKMSGKGKITIKSKTRI